MFGKSVKSVTLAAAICAMTIGGAGVATAETAGTNSPAAAIAADGNYQVRGPQVSYTFNHDQSVALYNAAKTGGAGAVGVLCARFAGAIGGVACGVLAAYIIDTLTDPPAANECYQVYPRLGNPPIGVRTVNC